MNQITNPFGDILMIDIENLLTAEELAERFRVKPGTVREWARKGVIPSVKPGHKTLRFDPVEVSQALMERRRDRARERARERRGGAT